VRIFAICSIEVMRRQPDERELIKLLEAAGYIVGVSRIGSEWRCSLHTGNLRSVYYAGTEHAALWHAAICAGVVK
jgi:hypothetical protein